MTKHRIRIRLLAMIAMGLVTSSIAFGQAAPSVAIGGPATVDRYCAAYVPSDAAACGTFPAPNITLTTRAAPAGGTYSWAITNGATRVAFVGATNQASVVVRGTMKSAAANDVTITVTYTVGLMSVMATHTLTVREPSAMTSATANAAIPAGTMGYAIIITYTVRDQFNNTMGAGICVDETVTVCSQSHPVNFNFGDAPTNGTGRVQDRVGLTTTNPAGIPATMCILLDQDITAGGCGPLLNNTMLFQQAMATVAAGNCVAGAMCP
jgi:hypothetical protein